MQTDEGSNKWEAAAEPRTPAGPVLSRHWGWRPEWTAEQRMWWWYATFGNVAPARRLAERAREALRPDAPVDVVPPEWLHLTLAEVGESRSFPRRLAYEAARAAAVCVSELPPVNVQVGPVRTMPGAVVLRVRGEGLRAVYDRLVAALPSALPGQPVQRPFDPHISIAYVASDCRSSDVLRADVHTGALLHMSVKATLDHVSLVEVVRDRGHYRWTPRCSVSLKGRPRPSSTGEPQPVRHLRSVD